MSTCNIPVYKASVTKSKLNKWTPLPPFQGPTEPVLTGSGCVIMLERGQGGISVCVQASVHPSSSSSPPSFCADGVSVEGMAGLRHRGTEDYCN